MQTYLVTGYPKTPKTGEPAIEVPAVSPEQAAEYVAQLAGCLIRQLRVKEIS